MASCGILGRNVVVNILVIIFAISSWVEVNGLWVELPIMIQNLPEQWDLASYIVITSQLANIGPIIYSIARRRFSRKVLEIPAIHSVLFVGTLSCLLLALFWDRTSIVGGAPHSTALLILTFFLAFVDCTTSVLYLPFMANFAEKYIVLYFVGEGMSGVLPSFVALAQGVGGNPVCKNVTVTVSQNVTVYELKQFRTPPRFSANLFFGLLTVTLVISWTAFLLLNYLPQAKKEWVTSAPREAPSNPAVEQNFMASTSQNNSLSAELSSSRNLSKPLNRLTPVRYFFLLLIQTYIALLHNVILSIQTYSCLPYGNLAYHLAVNLSSISSPLASFSAMFMAVKSLTGVAVLTVHASSWAAYILATAILSPYPPLLSQTSGSAIVIISWILVTSGMAYTKAVIASILRVEGGYSALFWCGVANQIGSAVGAMITFGLVNYSGIFHSYSPC